MLRREQFIFGAELHSLWLEGTREEEMSEADEELLLTMYDSLVNSPAQEYVEHAHAQLELEIKKKLYDVPCLGYLDIFNKHTGVGGIIADLKTTSTNSPEQFLHSCILYDYFRQAYFYQRLTGVEDFVFIAVSKVFPHRVHMLHVKDHPRQMFAAKQEFEFLLYYYGKHHAV